MTDTTQLLKEMAQLSAVTGRISDIQEQNLKMFPLVFFHDVTEAKVEYNLSPIEADGIKLICTEPTVRYSLKLDESKNDDLEKRFEALEKSITTLFWAGIKVEVFFNGKLKHGSSTNGL